MQRLKLCGVVETMPMALKSNMRHLSNTPVAGDKHHTQQIIHPADTTSCLNAPNCHTTHIYQHLQATPWTLYQSIEKPHDIMPL